MKFVIVLKFESTALQFNCVGSPPVSVLNGRLKLLKLALRVQFKNHSTPSPAFQHRTARFTQWTHCLNMRELRLPFLEEPCD